MTHFYLWGPDDPSDQNGLGTVLVRQWSEVAVEPAGSGGFRIAETIWSSRSPRTAVI